MQQKYMEMQLLEQKIKQVQSQLHAITTQLFEIDATIGYVNEFKELKKGSETLVPLSNGIFFKTSLKENDTFIVNVGSGIAVNKTPEQLNEMLGKQKEELAEVQKRLLVHLERLGAQAQKTEEELAKLVQ